MLNTAFPPWPSFSIEEANAVRDVLLSNRVNQWTGEHVQAFEQEFAEYVGTRHAVAVANGTLALELCFHAISLKPMDEVIVTPRTFLASASSIVVSGARPVFVDVDADSQAITAETIRPHITAKTRAIVVVHLAGRPADMDPIMELAERHNLIVIEDCAQAHGARYRGRSVGSIGHLAAWSFCQDKIMTTGGEGGMVTTDSSAYEERMWAYKDHGKSRQAMQQPNETPGFKWIHETIGTNWRMLEMQAVLGRIQLKKLENWQQQRSKNAAAIVKYAKQFDWIRVPKELPEGDRNASYKCYLFVRPEKLPQGWTRNRILSNILDAGIPVYSGSCSEVNREKAFKGVLTHPVNPMPVARELGNTSLMFLVHPTLTNTEIKLTCNALSNLNKEMYHVDEKMTSL